MGSRRKKKELHIRTVDYPGAKGREELEVVGFDSNGIGT